MNLSKWRVVSVMVMVLVCSAFIPVIALTAGDEEPSAPQEKTAIMLFVSHRGAQPLQVSPTDVRSEMYRLLGDAIGEKGFETVEQDEIEPLIMRSRIRSGFDFGEDFLARLREQFSSDYLLVAQTALYSDRILLLGRVLDCRAGVLEWVGCAEVFFETKYEERADSLDEEWHETMEKVVGKLADSWELLEPQDGAVRLVSMPVMTAGSDHGQAEIATNALLRGLVEARSFVLIDPSLSVRFLNDSGYSQDFLIADARLALSEHFQANNLVVPRLISYAEPEGGDPRTFAPDDFLPPTQSTREPYFFTMMLIEGDTGTVSLSSGEYAEGENPVGLFGVRKNLSLENRFADASEKLAKTLIKHLEN